MRLCRPCEGFGDRRRTIIVAFAWEVWRTLADTSVTLLRLAAPYQGSR